ncbi:hypothetical protein [Adhaeribacter rhizoryzae]|nr:hypothetical protein [Adhaeribacter rhizoryzae]
MKTITNLFNLSALEWVHCCQESISVIYRNFTSPARNLRPLLITARVR